MARPALAQGQASGCGSRVLDVYTTVAGQRVDAAVVQFIIFERVTTPLIPIQVFPEVEDEREDVDVAQLCPDGGRLGLGHYVASWDVPVDALIGAYAIQWFFKLTVDSEEFTLVEDFDVVALVGTTDASHYCTLAEIRDEGVPATVTDARILRAIEVASRMIDGFTGRWFYPREMVFTVDGRAHATLRLGAPIISISSVIIDYWNTEPEEGMEVATESLEVYNRHISQNLTAPDDREDPKVVLRWTDESSKRLALGACGMLNFPKGTQNVRVAGTFGYTDYDGTATGCTPVLINEACRMLVMRKLPRKATTISGGSGPLKREKTREQEQEFGDPAKMAIQGAFTGDPEIDMILARYRRPLALGSA